LADGARTPAWLPRPVICSSQLKFFHGERPRC
jgi:hypothetical protein